MRKWIATLLHKWGEQVYPTDHSQQVKIIDEYGICRCVVDVISDEHGHGLRLVSDTMPPGWAWRGFLDGGTWP